MLDDWIRTDVLFPQFTYLCKLVVDVLVQVLSFLSILYNIFKFSENLFRYFQLVVLELAFLTRYNSVDGSKET